MLSICVSCAFAYFVLIIQLCLPRCALQYTVEQYWWHYLTFLTQFILKVYGVFSLNLPVTFKAHSYLSINFFGVLNSSNIVIIICQSTMLNSFLSSINTMCNSPLYFLDFWSSWSRLFLILYRVNFLYVVSLFCLLCSSRCFALRFTPNFIHYLYYLANTQSPVFCIQAVFSILLGSVWLFMPGQCYFFRLERRFIVVITN